MKNVLFYISGHGFGHSTRMIEVINELAPRDSEISFHIRTSAPRWLFKRDLRSRFNYSYLVCDVGIAQKDSLSLDRLETLTQYANFIIQKKSLIPQEVEFVKRNNVSLVIGDIPPLAFDVARKAGIPAIAITNFSWDWIYSPYVEEYPRYRYLLEEIRESYSKAEKLLRLPFSPEMPAFSLKEDIPLIARKSKTPKEEILKRVKISPNEKRKIVLLSFGGFAYPPNFFVRLSSCKDYLFLSSGEVKEDSCPNLVALPKRSPILHQDLVKVSDLVITKLGYGIVSECIANQTPIMYTSRDSPEHNALAQGLKKSAHAYFMSREDLLGGNWKAHLDSFFQTEYEWPGIRIDGAEVASRKILSEFKK
jgi:UDP:flavonoid glycosyltransferase YjiC (YdhE family)